MAVEMNPEVETPVSTHAVKFDGGPYVTEQTADNTSTGAVETPGPVTVTARGHSVKAKVVVAPEAPVVVPATVAETK